MSGLIARTIEALERLSIGRDGKCQGCWRWGSLGHLPGCPNGRVIADLRAVQPLLDAAEENVRWLKRIQAVGHGDDCIFCGFKDQAVRRALAGEALGKVGAGQ